MDIFLGSHCRPDFDQEPLTLVDVGARGGLQPNWRPAARHLKVVAFEPDGEEYRRLCAAPGSIATQYVNAALHRQPGELTLNVGRLGGTSSFLAPDWKFLNRFPDPSRYEVVRKQPVRVTTLDLALHGGGVTDPDFLKIDTQGAELAILQGGERTLRSHLLGLEVEVLFGSLYEGQPRFGDIDGLLLDLGFQTMDLRPSYWKRARGAGLGGPKGQLAFADVLYFRTEESLAAVLAAIADPTRRRRKLLRAMAISLLYGYVDYALEIFAPHGQLFAESDRAGIEAFLLAQKSWSTALPHFRGRGWLSHLFYRLHRFFFPTLDGWASGGRHLGNVD